MTPRTKISTRIALAAALAVAPAGCGGAEHGHHEHGGEHGHDHGQGHEHGDHGKGHAALPPGSINDLHEVIRPLWHAEKNAEREKKTCAATGEMKKHAAAIESGPTPGPAKADEAGWKKDAAGMTASIGALEAECAKGDGARAEFEARFSAVHDGFHAISARVGAKH